MHVREPLLKPVRVKDLRPTQITVGLREVKEKRAQWTSLSGKKKDRYLSRHLIPVIWGPKKNFYVIDHHHLSRALLDEGQTEVLITVVADLRDIDRESFWVVLDLKGLCHPYDEDGRRRDFKDIPGSIADLVDDPYRSLAGELRRAGGFAKDTTPFSEFLWADFYRRRIKRKLIEKDFDAALIRAMELAKEGNAKYLPGWCGPSSPPDPASR